MRFLICALLAFGCLEAGSSKQSMFEVLGIEKELWDTFNEDQRTEALKAFRERQKFEAGESRKVSILRGEIAALHRENVELRAVVRRLAGELDSRSIEFGSMIGSFRSLLEPRTRVSDHRIVSMRKGSFGDVKVLTLSRGLRFEIAFADSNKMGHWLEGQSISIRKAESYMYPVKIVNLQTGDSVRGKRL